MSVERSALSVERSGAAGIAIDADNPWPGLATFTEDQRAYFHGRDEEIIDLTQLAERRPLVVLFGQSGLGKSSILQAGVFPRMRADGFCPVYIRLDHGEGAPSPTEQIKELVRTETAKAGTWTKPGSAKPGETLWEFFHHRDDRLLDRDGLGVVPVLVFDQFEELFTLGAARGERRERAVAFMRELAELVENRPSAKLVARLDQSSEEMDAFDFGRTDYRVVISLREDFLPDLETLKTIMPALMQKRMRLARMTGQQALEAVLKPGAGLVDANVARAIVEFVAGARGGSAERLAELDVEPALLSVICRELNERRRALGQAQITADLVTGNRREILTDFYERSVADLPAGMRTFVEDRLLTKSGFRDNLALETALEFPGVTRPLIDTLVARRLLRIEDRLGVQRVELTHDVLAEVVRASRDARQQRLALEQAQERERHAVAVERRKSRRMRVAVGALTAAVVALSVGAVFGIRSQRRAAHLASQTDLMLGSRLLDEGKVADGLAHLVRAGRKDPLNELVAPRLLGALAGSNFALPTGAPLALPSPAFQVSYSPDGRSIIVHGEDGVVRIVDAIEWKVARELKFDQPVHRRGFRRADNNPDVIAVMLKDGAIAICDGQGQPSLPPIRLPRSEGPKAAKSTARTRVWSDFQLSRDGRWLAANDDATLWIWDARSGELRASLPHNGVFRFSPDGRRIAGLHRIGGARGGQRAGVTQVYSVPEGTRVGSEIPYAHSGSTDRFFSPDGEKLFVVHTAGVQAYEISSGKPAGPLLKNEAGSPYQCLLSPDGRRLIFLGVNAVVLDAATGERLYSPLEHGMRIPQGQISRDGRTLFTNCLDGLFRLWDLESGTLLASPMWRQEQYTPAVLAPDGKHTLVFTAAGPVHRIALGRGAAAPLELTRASATRLSNFLGEPPARIISYGAKETEVMDVSSGRTTDGGFRLPPSGAGLPRSRYGNVTEPGEILMAQTDGVWHAWILGHRGIDRDVPLDGSPTWFVGSGRNFVAFSLESQGVHEGIGIWELQTGRMIATIKEVSWHVAFAPDDTRLAFQTLDEVVHVCEVGTGRELFTVELVGRESIAAFRFAPDSRHLLTGGSWGGLQVWDATTGARFKDIQAHRSAVLRFDFSRDGRTISSLSSDGTAHLWESRTYERVSSIKADTSSGGRNHFSHDGSRIVAPLGNFVRVWDVRSGLPVTDRLNHHIPVTVVSYSPDGAFVMAISGAAGRGPTQRFWSVPPRAKGHRTPGWLLTLATICAGQRLTDDGKLVSAVDDFAKLEELRETVAALPSADPFAEWGRWLLSTSPVRSIAPGFSITPDQAKELQKVKAEAAAEDVAATEQNREALDKYFELSRGRKWPEAETLARQNVARLEELDGRESRGTVVWYFYVAHASMQQDRLDEAEESIRTAYRLVEQFGILTGATRRLLGQILFAQGQFEEAEPHLLAGYDDVRDMANRGGTVRNVFGQLWLDVRKETAGNLMELYTATNQPEKAAEWKRIAEGATAPAANRVPEKNRQSGKTKAP